MALKFCPNCGRKNVANSNFCPDCGANLQEEKKKDEFVIHNGVLEKYNGDKSVVVIPSNVTVIGSYVFPPSNHIFNIVSNITKVVLPYGLKKISSKAFFGCTNLRYVDLPSTLEEIGENAFEETCIEETTIPRRMTVIEKSAFYRCLSLAKVNLPEGIVEIKDSAFEACVPMKSIRLPRSLRKIGHRVFRDDYLHDIYYPGTKAEFNKIESTSWKGLGGMLGELQSATVHCSDGDFKLSY